MAQIRIEFTWKTLSDLSIHSGIARAQAVDREVRARNGKPELRGEAIKGAIREAAERLLRWIKVPGLAEENETRSVPTHPVLQRLFAPELAQGQDASAARYSFRSSRAGNGTRAVISSTKVDLMSGAADDTSLRAIEVWRRGVEFPIAVTALGVDLSDPRDRLDLQVFLVSIAAVDSIGGNRTIGRGQAGIAGLTVRCDTVPLQGFAPETLVEEVVTHLGGTIQ